MIELKVVNVGHYVYDTLVVGNLELVRFYYNEKLGEWILSSKLMNIEMDSFIAENKEDAIREILDIVGDFACKQISLYESIVEEIFSINLEDNEKLMTRLLGGSEDDSI